MLGYEGGRFYAYLRTNEELEIFLEEFGLDREVDCSLDGETFKRDGYRLTVQWWKFTDASQYRWRVVISH